MNYNTKIEIRLSDVYENNVTSRASISTLLDKYKNSKQFEIVLNFSRIIFLSRSSAQQIILEKEKFKVNKTIITYINLNPEVSKMLNVAENKERRLPVIEHKEFSSTEELEEFMLSF